MRNSKKATFVCKRRGCGKQFGTPQGLHMHTFRKHTAVGKNTRRKQPVVPTSVVGKAEVLAPEPTAKRGPGRPKGDYVLRNAVVALETKREQLSDAIASLKALEMSRL